MLKNRALPYDPAYPLLCIYPKNTRTLIGEDICTPVFIAALFTIQDTERETTCVHQWMNG